MSLRFRYFGIRRLHSWIKSKFAYFFMVSAATDFIRGDVPVYIPCCSKGHATGPPVAEAETSLELPREERGVIFSLLQAFVHS